MKLLEHEGKEIFAEYGFPVTKGIVVDNVNEAVVAANNIGYPVVIKAQVLTGGRGKAGGVKIAEDEYQVKEKASQILGLDIKGEITKSILITEAVEIAQEIYVGITLDPAVGLPVLIFSSDGGVEIETIAKESPEKLHKLYLNPTKPIRQYNIIDFLRKTDIDKTLLNPISKTINQLIAAFFGVDATTAEINPLVVTKDNKVLALDSKIVIDDSALPRQFNFKQKEETLSPLEERAKNINVNYVPLKGNIAVIAGGAGLAMATMDLVFHLKGNPASFLDTGGGISSERMAEALRISLANKNVEGVIINVFGGINNCETMAKGIAEVVDNDNPKAKIVVKMRGHSQDEGWKILEDRNIPIIKYGSSEEAVQLLLDTVKGEA